MQLCFYTDFQPSPVSPGVDWFVRPVRPIGRGGFGTAYLVRPQGEWTVLRVLKCVDMGMMDKRQQADALNECAVLAKLRRHHFIISLHEHFQELGRLWIVMDYADGGDLAEQITAMRSAGKSFPEKQVVDWVTQIGLALQHAHSHKVLHRDIKPQNVFLSGSGDVKLGARAATFESAASAAAHDRTMRAFAARRRLWAREDHRGHVRPR